MRTNVRGCGEGVEVWRKPARASPVENHYRRRPQLRDPADEMVLEAAVNGGATAIATFNVRDFGASAAKFRIALLTPSAPLRRIRS